MPFITFELRRGVTPAKVDRYLATVLPNNRFTPAVPVHPPETLWMARMLHERALRLQKALGMIDRRSPGDIPQPVSGSFDRERLIRYLPRGMAVQGQYDLAAPPRIALDRVCHVWTDTPKAARTISNNLKRSSLVERIFPIMVAAMPSPEVEQKNPRNKGKDGKTNGGGGRSGEITGDGPSAEVTDPPSPESGCVPMSLCDAYLDRAIGVGARPILQAANSWGLSPGHGVRIGLIELDFPEFFYNVALPGTGAATSEQKDHSLKDLSILFGTKQAMTGLAPLANLHPFAVHAQIPHPEIEEPFIGQLVQAILAATGSLLGTPGGRIGSVLLVEVELVDQDGVRWPAYLHPYVRHVLQLAWGAGIMVVLPAGNEHRDLSLSWSVVDFDLGIPKWPGALVVGGAWPRGKVGGECQDLVTAAHGFGSPVDCFSWASSVQAQGLAAAPTEHDGTSSASAIIAGAACLLQSAIFFLTDGGRLDADTLGTCLIQRSMNGPTGDTWTTGVPSASQVDGSETSSEVGVQPQLDQILNFWLQHLGIGI